MSRSKPHVITETGLQSVSGELADQFRDGLTDRSARAMSQAYMYAFMALLATILKVKYASLQKDEQLILLGSDGPPPSVARSACYCTTQSRAHCR